MCERWAASCKEGKLWLKQDEDLKVAEMIVGE